jgi:hypothetical protein
MKLCAKIIFNYFSPGEGKNEGFIRAGLTKVIVI